MLVVSFYENEQCRRFSSVLPAISFALSAHRLALMRSSLMMWFAAIAGVLPSDPNVTRPLLGLPSRQSARRTAAVTAAEDTGVADYDGAGLRDEETGLEPAVESPPGSPVGSYVPPVPPGSPGRPYVPPGPPEQAGNVVTQAFITQGVQNPHQQRPIEVTPPAPDQQQLLHVGLLAGPSQPIQVQEEQPSQPIQVQEEQPSQPIQVPAVLPLMAEEAGPPVIPPTPPSRLRPQARPGGTRREA
jgi:hypothetical protein